jgi:hypothetical protein
VPHERAVLGVDVAEYTTFRTDRSIQKGRRGAQEIWKFSGTSTNTATALPFSVFRFHIRLEEGAQRRLAPGFIQAGRAGRFCTLTSAKGR